MTSTLSSASRDILIVDDTQTNLQLLTRILSERGYRVRAVLNGTRALAAALASPPGLILLDINMPDMSGYEVCERLKADPRTCDIPVLFISALSETQDKLKGFAVGGVDYITKPFQVEEVLARVQTHLALRNTRRLLEMANLELERRLLELQARNEELDAFAHTVAHDLKKPLQAMISGSALLGEYFADLTEAERLDVLQTLTFNSRKMADIVDALLMLAQVRQTQVELVPVNMQSLVFAVLQRLADTIQELQAEIHQPDKWPDAQGYGPWVEEVWMNYLSNALKYGGRPPRLTLGAQHLPDGNVRYWVQDNGAGIPPADQTRLFAPFTRLDFTQAGHGLGLSIVRRIVEKLGGQVSLESTGTPGEGSTFSFTLPT